MTTLLCSELQKRLDLFLDGEAEGRTMRDLAMHVAGCVSCEADVRDHEKMKASLATFIETEIDKTDSTLLWRRVESGLDPISLPLWSRLRESVARGPWALAVPALAAAASFALVVGLASEGSSPERTAALAPDLNEAHIESLDSSSTEVAVWSEPIEHTTAIWVASYEP